MKSSQMRPGARRLRKEPIRHLFALILVLAAALAPTHVMADVTETPADAQDGTDVKTDEEAVRRLLEHFRAARLSLREAMVIAEKLHRGSRTVQISFEPSASPGYRVKTVKKDEIWENVVDAMRGSVKGAEVVSSLQDLDRDDRGKVIALKSVEQELSDAVAVAERATSGKAIGGGLMKDNGKLIFVVVVVASGDSLKEVMLEPPRIGRQGSAAGQGPEPDQYCSEAAMKNERGPRTVAGGARTAPIRANRRRPSGFPNWPNSLVRKVGCVRSGLSRAGFRSLRLVARSGWRTPNSRRICFSAWCSGVPVVFPISVSQPIRTFRNGGDGRPSSCS